jgi:hydrocephalus-inducing protein
MYATRSMKFTIKNTSLIGIEYNFKIVNAQTGILDAGPFTIIPKKGTIAPSCDENFILKFAPVEVEQDFTRILSANINHLSADQEPLIIEANGIAERPVIHFELPLSSYRERKAKEQSFLDEKLKIIEFESLGTNIRNTNRFMAVNPTSQGYEFEWEEISDETNKKTLFKCATPKGIILSGKKTEMVFEYIPN